ncbi:hypothetical protein [Usitatibacter palustris]|uniref:Uncharacterized protein n=1 Tax=Usitatibacter palustris TaxID=2732487 RepID=A0A6M4H6M6_9PROT|nr:hypothetical protein [Usitatibacter palustris]QJR14313.1 hypothetical protein DSM104440_01109 [Usitatibacter palustris]
MDEQRLRQENETFTGTGGRSQENRELRFRPAFLDCATMAVYVSRFADGRPAPFHVLDGLPDEVVIDRTLSGRVVSTKSTLIAGFERGGYFFTRTAAARAVVQWTPAAS